MKRILLLSLALLIVSVPAFATTSNSIRTRAIDGYPLVLVYSKSIASGVIDTCTVSAKGINWTYASLLNTGSASAPDSISFGLDSSVDGTTWTQLRNIALTGFVGAVAKQVTMSAPGVYLRFRVTNKHGSAAKTVSFKFVPDVQ